MIKDADEDAGLVAKTAVIESLWSGYYCVRITRADGEVVPIRCILAETAVGLIIRLNLVECFISIPEGPARDALLAALRGDGHSPLPFTRH